MCDFPSADDGADSAVRNDVHMTTAMEVSQDWLSRHSDFNDASEGRRRKASLQRERESRAVAAQMIFAKPLTNRPFSSSPPFPLLLSLIPSLSSTS